MAPTWPLAYEGFRCLFSGPLVSCDILNSLLTLLRQILLTGVSHNYMPMLVRSL